MECWYQKVLEIPVNVNPKIFGIFRETVNPKDFTYKNRLRKWLIESPNNKKRSHTQLDSRKQVIAFQDRVMTINIKEAQHPLKREKQVIDKSSIMLKISTKSMHRVLV